MNTWIKEGNFKYKEYSVKASRWWELKLPSDSITFLKQSWKSHVSILFIPLAFVERNCIFVMLILRNPKQDGDCCSSQFWFEFTYHSVPSQDARKGKLFTAVPRSRGSQNKKHWTFKDISRWDMLLFFYFLSSTLSIENNVWWMIVLGLFNFLTSSRSLLGFPLPQACASDLCTKLL